jgi:hypothetical protein
LDDVSNWEFAAAVAAICIGLGGLLLFTIVGTIGAWRMFAQASRTSQRAEEALAAMQTMTRQAPPAPESATVGLAPVASRIAELREQVEALLNEQARLREMIENIATAPAVDPEEAKHARQLLDSIKQRIDADEARVSDARSALTQHAPDARGE